MSQIAPVRFGILGAGRIARHQIAPALSQIPTATLYAAASRDIERAESLKPERAYSSYDALLDDPHVEVVYIATHNGLHHPLAIRALENNKHVICEKPLAPSVSECAEILAAAEQHGRLLLEAFMYRHHPQIAKVVDLIEAGAIGETTAIEASFSFRLAEPDDVRLKREWGGGSLLDVGCYCINACRFFMKGEPTAVAAMAHIHPLHRVDMSIHGLLQFSSHRYAVVSCGFEGGLRNRILISGSDATIELPTAFITVGSPCELRIHRGGKTENVMFPDVNVFHLQIEDFARAVRTGTEPMLSPDEGLKNAKVFEALISASEKGCVVPVGI